jgi:hypothetical protein
MHCVASLVLTCPECATELPLSARFCTHCATPLTPVSATPEERAPAGGLDAALRRLIPTEYAERLLAARGQATHERRLVTMLFADVAGSTALPGIPLRLPGGLERRSGLWH